MPKGLQDRSRLDMTRFSSRAILFAVTARRALWLKPWLPDPTLKSKCCKIPYMGSSLFGSKLDTAISKVTMAGQG